MMKDTCIVVFTQEKDTEYLKLKMHKHIFVVSVVNQLYSLSFSKKGKMHRDKVERKSNNIGRDLAGGAARDFLLLLCSFPHFLY